MIFNDTLETPRLVIRPFEAGDAATLVEIFSDPMVARYVGDGDPLSPEQAALWVERSGENLRRFGYGTGAVVEKASGQLIGWTGFARPKDGPEELIYGFAAPYWRQGFGTEILEALLQFADTRGMDPVYATVYPANTYSVRLLTSHGFELVESAHGGDANTDLYRRTAKA